jgi:hypothetical protein
MKAMMLVKAAIRIKDNDTEFVVSNDPVAEIERFFDAELHHSVDDNKGMHDLEERYFNALVNTIINKGLVSLEYANAIKKFGSTVAGYEFKASGAVQMNIDGDKPLPLPENYRPTVEKQDEEFNISAIKKF